MIKVFPNGDELNRFAAEKFVEIGNEAINERGFFSVVLAGGSTPKTLYQLLASEEFRDQIDWTRCIFFFGDERNVAQDAEQSNLRMADENLFKPLVKYRLKIPRQTQPSKTPRFPNSAIHRLVDPRRNESLFGVMIFWQTPGEDTKKIAADYEKAIRTFFDLSENAFPRFDLILLGMGDDGHTASLFPFTEALNETEKIAVANKVEKLETTRLTLTFPVINNARNVIFLVKGEDKAKTLREVLHGEIQPEKLPAQNVRPANGELFWLIDREAARFL